MFGIGCFPAKKGQLTSKQQINIDEISFGHVSSDFAIENRFKPNNFSNSFIFYKEKTIVNINNNKKTRKRSTVGRNFARTAERVGVSQTTVLL